MSTTCDRSPQPFLHRALVYSSREELLDILAARARVDAHDPVLISVDPETEAQLRKLLGEHADTVDFVDPETLAGSSTGRTIRRFMTTARQAASPGPVSVLVQHPFERSDDEARLKLECEMNADIEDIAVDLVCLYDLGTCDAAIPKTARNTLMPDHVGGAQEAHPLGAAYDVHWFDHLDSASLRGWLYFHAAMTGLPTEVADEFVGAVHDAATTASDPSAGTPGAGVAFGEPTLGAQRTPVRIWPGRTRVTCEIPVDPAVLGVAEGSAGPLSASLGAVAPGEADTARPSVRIDIYRDGPQTGRILVHADQDQDRDHGTATAGSE